MPRSLFILLLVEDNPGDVILFKEALKQTSVPIQLTTARDGRAALALLAHEPDHEALWPDLIVLDLNLPQVNGQTVLAWVKSDKALKHIPVVILTNSTEPEDIQQSYALGANAYVQKPLELRDYFAMVE